MGFERVDKHRAVAFHVIILVVGDEVRYVAFVIDSAKP